MAIISPFTLIRAISLFHLTAAWLFLTDPRVISDQNVIFVLGEAMGIPHATSLDKPSQASGFIAVVLAFLGIADLVASSISEDIALEYWLTNVPVRLTFLFGLTGYVYLYRDQSSLVSAAFSKASIGEPIQNSMVFAFGFFEIALWFWTFGGLRDERSKLARKQLEKKQAEENRL